MQYILAIAFDHHIYWMHNKIYFNKKRAINALKTMRNNGFAFEDAKVYEVSNWGLREATTNCTQEKIS